MTYEYSGHVYRREGLARRLLAWRHEKDMDDVKVVVDGVIPAADVAQLKHLGVAVVFPGGTPGTEIITMLRSLAAPSGETGLGSTGSGGAG